MSDEPSARYDPAAVEPRWTEVWAERVNRADPDSAAARAGRTFTVMIPPPNVTGALHMGHALNDTLQDVLTRLHRMRGEEALWLPGTDHAGIATQAVVEKQLYQERGIRRQDLGRDAFLEEVWAWKRRYGDRILFQLRRLGASCDWSRTKFTLDEDMSRAVREAFVRLWEKGLVYRGARLVNWDCVLRTAVSDDEIEYVARRGRLYRLRYPLVDDPSRHVEVATTRPETMLGDTGVAVHPDDPRYADLVGRTLRLPLVGREIPVVADASVDPAFGTGAVKVTPGHDPADYDRGARHGLPIVNVLNPDGTLADTAGSFAGLPREKARKAVLAALGELGLLGAEEEIDHNVAISDRSKSDIEPLVSEQWFVKMRPLAGPAIRAVRDGSLRIVPERWTKVYLDWLENVRDWCISRQLWWGHRIPVWYDEDGVPVASREDLALGSPHPLTGRPVVRQDEDVLDTWASSWLWPFATLGWPERTRELAAFYPTQFLATSREIIYLWVARMVMAGYEFLDHLPEERRCPFSVCYIHATVLDAQGRRMSKSLGNGIDPVEMVEQYGADAVRFTLVYLTTEGQDVKLDPKRFEMGRNFVNKLWNAARFAQQKALDGWTPRAAHAADLAAEDRWILTELTRARRAVSRALDAYQFNLAAQAIYDFTWSSFCDWYLELVKPRLEAGGAEADAARSTVLAALTGILRMLHPIAPFVTEELWERLRPWHGEETLLARAAWDAPEFEDPEAALRIAALQEFVRTVRNLRNESRVPEKEPVDVLVVPKADGGLQADALRRHEAQFLRLANASSLRVDPAGQPPRENASHVLPFADVFVDLAGKIDLAAERERLDRELERAARSLEQSERKLANEGFVARAPAEVVEQERARAAEHRERLGRLRELRGRLG